MAAAAAAVAAAPAAAAVPAAPPPVAGVKRSHAAMMAGGGSGSSSSSVSRAAFLQTPVREAERGALRHLLLDLIFHEEAVDRSRFVADRAELPGPLAVGLCHRTLALVAAHDYMVCEKSDGERCMLLVLPRPHGGVPPGAYLFNRAFDAYRFDGGAAYVDMLGRAGTLLLDGELILRTHDYGTGVGCAIYMMFDAIVAGGQRIAQLGLAKRLDAIGAVRVDFRNAEEAAARAGTLRPPLYLSGKAFAPKRDVGSVLDRISEEAEAEAGSSGGAGGAPLMAPFESEGGGAMRPHRLYRHDYRVNGTDGLVFTPVGVGYTALMGGGGGGVLPLLKWKFADENTIDLRMKLSEVQAASAGAVGRGDTRGVTVPVNLTVVTGRDGAREIETRLAKTLLTVAACDAYERAMQARGVDSFIVECGYDIAASSWVIKRVRDRKTRANHLTTAWQTMEVMAENITPAELRRTLASAGSGGAGAGTMGSAVLVGPPAPAGAIGGVVMTGAAL